MKLNQIIFIFLILLISLLCFGQEKPAAVLTYEISNPMSCNIGKLSIDILYSEISTNPTSTGYIIIYGEQNNQLKNYYHEQMLKNFVSYRKFDLKRIVFAHAKSEKAIRIQIWQVPVDADKPSYVEENWDYVLPRISKGFIFYQEYNDSIGACDTVNSNFDELYSKILSNNPNLLGHLVIYENSDKAFRETEKKVLNQLTKTYKIPHKKLKVFYVKAKEFSDVEYWIVPQRKK